LDLVGDKWTLLIIRDLAAGPRRFVELQRVLPGISTEQLRSRLNRMVADGMLTRRRFREVPPRVEYELTERARDLMPIIGELARWGYIWTWSAPREGEQIDIDAILRLAPGLAHLPRDVRGRLELTVTDGRDNGPVSLVLTVSAGEVAIEEGVADDADARISAPTAVWVRAFLPAGERGGLRIEGDRSLAMRVLDALTPQEFESARAKRVRIA
jgi:DNA-binding HxlR family transcriptional regulator